MTPLRDVCPICDGRVESIGNATRVEIGLSAVGNERAKCSGCEVRLIRGADDDAAPWLVDRMENTAEQCRARLRALAAAHDLEFEDAHQSSPDVWRCYLYERGGTENAGRVAIVHGADISEEGALQKMVYEAENKGLI
jgi:hypothetical protein